MSTLADILAQETREGELYETLPDGQFILTVRRWVCRER